MTNIFNRFYRWLKRPAKTTLGEYAKTFIIIVPIAFVIRTYFYGLYQVPTGSMETTMLVGERFFADKFSVFFWSPKHGDIISFNDPNFNYSTNSFVRTFQRYVWGPSNWTKRVIGIPGDHIQGKMEDGKPVVYRNGEKLDEPYLNQYPIVGVMNGQSGKLWDYRSYDEKYSFENQPFYIMNPEDVYRAKRLMPRYGFTWDLKPHTPSFDHASGRNADEYDIKLGPNEYWAMGDNRLGSYDCRMWAPGGKPLNGELIHGKIVFRILSFDSSESWLLLDLIKHPIEFWRRVRWSRCLNVVR